MGITYSHQDGNQQRQGPLFNANQTISSHPAPTVSGDEDWEENFQYLFDRAVDAFETGVRDPDRMFSDDEKAFLESIGAKPQEIFDYVEDWAEDGEPTPETVREVTGLRRKYFLKVQEGKDGSAPKKTVTFPAPGDSFGGHRWLPRIIAKARAKLRGDLPTDLMYGCGMDRPFLRKRNIELPEFLKVVWEAGENDEKILQYVDQKARGPEGG